MTIDWQGVYEHWDEMDRTNEEKHWEAEKQRLLADMEDETPSPPPPRRRGLFRRDNRDSGYER